MLFYPGDEFTSDSMKLMAALKTAQSAAQPSPPYIPQPLVTDPVSPQDRRRSLPQPTLVLDQARRLKMRFTPQRNFFSNGPVTVAESF